jgi:hypothetical protein
MVDAHLRYLSKLGAFMIFKALLPVAALAVFGTASAANALTITVEPGSNLADFSYTVDAATRTINIWETFGPDTANAVVLKFTDWTYNAASWTVNKYVTNLTGDDWNSFSHELLQSNKGGSPDKDGLSFAQHGSPFRTRASDAFSNVTADELLGRDYLLFDGGTVVTGSTAWFTFGLTARRSADVGGTFYLRQAEFLDAVPEPATWAMLVLGFGFVGASMRRRRLLASVSA